MQIFFEDLNGLLSELVAIGLFGRFLSASGNVLCYDFIVGGWPTPLHSGAGITAKGICFGYPGKDTEAGEEQNGNDYASERRLSLHGLPPDLVVTEL
jgi:hypothetical protein